MLKFSILRSRNFCRQSSSKVRSLGHINPIPLFYKIILARIMLSGMKTSRLFIFLLSSCDTLLHGKLVVVASRWRLKFSFLKSNDVLDAVLSTDLEEQRCFKFLIRQLVSLNKTKIISGREQWETVRCLWFLWCEGLACDWLQHKHSRHIFGVHANIITAVKPTRGTP